MRMLGYESLAEWAFDYYVENDDIETAIEAFSGERSNEKLGEAALIEAVAAEASEEIESLLDDDHENAIEAFNEATQDFPHRARTIVAAVEATKERNNEKYCGEVEKFAKNAGYFANGQAALPGENAFPDDGWETNPLEEDGVGLAKAEIITRARLLGEDISDLDLAEIEQPEQFFEWLDELGSAEAAFRAQYFPDGTPEEVILGAKDPREWDELDPESVRFEYCVTCSERAYEVETENGVEWVSFKAEVGEIAEVSDVSGEFKHLGLLADGVSVSDSETVVCPTCISEYFEEQQSLNGVIMGIDSDGNKCLVGHNFEILRDYVAVGERSGEGFVSVEELNDEMFNTLAELLLHGPSIPDFFYVQPGDGPGTALQEANERVHEVIFGQNHEGLSGPMFISLRPSDGSYRIHFPRTSSQAASQAKHIIEPQPA